MAEGRWQKKERTLGKKGVIKANSVSLEASANYSAPNLLVKFPTYMVVVTTK